MINFSKNEFYFIASNNPLRCQEWSKTVEDMQVCLLIFSMIQKFGFPRLDIYHTGINECKSFQSFFFFRKLTLESA